MVTMVGYEADMKSLVEDLILLEYDAIAAYDTSIERLKNKSLSDQIASFKNDHLEHLATLKGMATDLAFKPPTEGGLKQYLTTGKIVLADLFGDAAILKAMQTNEDDTVTAYSRACDHISAIPDDKAFFRHALEDERRHRRWMENAAAGL